MPSYDDLLNRLLDPSTKEGEHKVLIKKLRAAKPSTSSSSSPRAGQVKINIDGKFQYCDEYLWRRVELRHSMQRRMIADLEVKLRYTETMYERMKKKKMEVEHKAWYGMFKAVCLCSFLYLILTIIFH